MVVTGIAVHDVEVMHLLEVVLCGVGSIYTRYARVEAAAEDSRETGFLEALAISPLPTILKVSHVLRLIVSGVEVVHATLKAGVHDSEVLVGQSHIDNDVGLVLLEESNKLGHTVGIDVVGDNVWLADGTSHGITLALRARSNHYLVENIGILCTLVGDHCANASRSNNQYFTHLKFR